MWIAEVWIISLSIFVCLSVCLCLFVYIDDDNILMTLRLKLFLSNGNQCIRMNDFNITHLWIFIQRYRLRCVSYTRVVYTYTHSSLLPSADRDLLCPYEHNQYYYIFITSFGVHRDYWFAFKFYIKFQCIESIRLFTINAFLKFICFVHFCYIIMLSLHFYGPHCFLDRIFLFWPHFWFAQIFSKCFRVTT